MKPLQTLLMLKASKEALPAPTFDADRRLLRLMPELESDAMRRGVLSYCKVRAMTRVATPENEQAPAAAPSAM